MTVPSGAGVISLPRASGGRPLHVRFRPQVINLLVGDDTPSYSFDLAGRLLGTYQAGVSYRRGLDNRVLARWHGTDGSQARQRRWLSAEEAAPLIDDAYALARWAAAATGDARLAPVAGWDAAALAADAERFAAVYRPVSILPPDQYLALVIQATEGCSYNRCTFCGFYRDRQFRIKSPDEMRTHVQAIQDFFGAGISLRRDIFVADANALVAPMPRLRAWLDVLQAAPGLKAAKWYSFIDAFDVHRKQSAEWAELAARGLQRVYIGMESGDPALLKWLRKPGTPEDVTEAVRLLKGCGVAVSVIVMVGIGGRRYAEAHVRNTVETLNRMPLGAGDIIYLSPFVDFAGSDYATAAEAAGIEPLDPGAIDIQERAIRAGLRMPQPAPQIARYDIREFVY